MAGGGRSGRILRWGLALALAAGGVLAGPTSVSPSVAQSVAASAGADATAARTDRLVVRGYDDLTGAPARVIARKRFNNLVATFVAASPLADGTLSLRLPRRSWPTRLHHTRYFRGDPGDRGGFSPRPVAPWFTPKEGDCTAAAGTRLTWTRVETARAQRVVVEHLRCDAGDRIEVRMRLLKAPPAGRARWRARIVDVDGSRQQFRPVVRVRPMPHTRLTITVPRHPTYRRPFWAVVRALHPDGRRATRFTGRVAVHSRDQHDCNFEGYESRTWSMARSDRGRIRLRLRVDTGVATRLSIRDVARRARPGVSRRFAVRMPASVTHPGAACPVAFH